MKLSRITLRWAGLKVQDGSKNLAIVHGRVRDDVEKKNANEVKRQMKNSNNNKIKINITKTSGENPSKHHRWEFLIILWLLMIICDLCKLLFMIIIIIFKIIDNY